jgi:hypothetical protein
MHDEPTALDDYVNFDDGYFEWSILRTYRFEENSTTVYMMNMTSQKWMDGGSYHCYYTYRETHQFSTINLQEDIAVKDVMQFILYMKCLPKA